MSTQTCKDTILELSTRFGLSEVLERVYELIDVQGTPNDQLITTLESALENAIQAALALEAHYEDLTPGGAFEAIRQVKIEANKAAA